MSQRRRYGAEFKREAVALVDAGQSVEAAAEALGIAHGTLWNWVAKAHRPTPAVPTDRVPVDAAVYQAALKRIAELELENEFLGKASAYFAGKAQRKS